MDLRAWVEGLPDIAVVDVCEKLVDFLNEHVAGHPAS